MSADDRLLEADPLPVDEPLEGSADDRLGEADSPLRLLGIRHRGIALLLLL